MTVSSDLSSSPTPTGMASSPSPAASASPPRGGAKGAGLWALLALVALGVAAGGSWYAWRTQERVGALEQELVKRQQEAQNQSADARLMAKQAQDAARESAAKTALLEARVAEVAVQRSQLEELMQTVARSRDENMLTDVEASVRVAQRQALVTGSVEPLVAALKQADERLARYDQPRLEGVRRAIARDLERAGAAGVADIATLTIKLDEAVRLVDEMPMLASAIAGGGYRVSTPPPSGSTSASSGDPWWRTWAGWSSIGERIWGEVRTLVRVTRIDHPEAVLMAPEQTLFLRENLKLRLLSARLSLLSRQYDSTQADLQAAQQSIDRYFDRSTRKAAQVADLVRQVTEQSRQVALPRADDTLAAVAAVTGGR